MGTGRARRGIPAASSLRAPLRRKTTFIPRVAPEPPIRDLNAYGQTGPLCRVIARATVNRIHYKGSANKGEDVIHKPICACA
jgi:hypothetical protein